jgi:hypothetical protein
VARDAAEAPDEDAAVAGVAPDLGQVRAPELPAGVVGDHPGDVADPHSPAAQAVAEDGVAARVVVAPERDRLGDRPAEHHVHAGALVDVARLAGGVAPAVRAGDEGRREDAAAQLGELGVVGGRDRRPGDRRHAGVGERGERVLPPGAVRVGVVVQQRDERAGRALQRELPLLADVDLAGGQAEHAGRHLLRFVGDEEDLHRLRQLEQPLEAATADRCEAGRRHDDADGRLLGHARVSLS